MGSDHPAFTGSVTEVDDRERRLLSVKGTKTVDELYRQMGHMVWEYCGMSRSEAGLTKLLDDLPALREELWKDLKVPGSADSLNQALEKAGRVSDFLELAELMAVDALHRTESCGGHFREESQTEEGEAKRDDEHFSYVAAWGWSSDTTRIDPVERGPIPEPVLNREPLDFEYVHLTQRSYK